MKSKRKYPFGAEISDRGVHFRIFAKDHTKATLILEKPNSEPKHHKMNKERGGYFSLFVKDVKAGDLYRFKLGNSTEWFPDPASRFQPLGPIGPSQIINPAFKWTDLNWSGSKMKGQILYEMHIGTFTEEGSYKAAKKELKNLSALGITTIELMPVHDFPGNFGWGYDGVNLFAPTHQYGTPSDLKDFINEAHTLNIGVILDVVYNHFGPRDNTIAKFAKKIFTPHYHTEWGEAINFDDKDVVEFFLTNVRYWIEEFHFDGLRFDAIPWIFSSTQEHILAKMTKTARKAAKKKSIILIAEDETQNVVHLKSYKEKGNGFDALWNDDFHHSAVVRMIGKKEAYYSDYTGNCYEFLSCLKYGFLYQGQHYFWQKKSRGTPSLNIPPESMVIFIENHDQVANTSQGLRLHQQSNPGSYRALTALLLLSPNTPMLFQGQEYGSIKPFHYFADHTEELNEKVKQGRIKFLQQFARLTSKEAVDHLPNPSDPKNFLSSKLDRKDKNMKSYLLHKDLIDLRKKDAVLKNMQKLKIEGINITEDALILRYFGQNEDRLLIINFGTEFIFNPASCPLIAPRENAVWKILWSSDSPQYGGDGTAPIHLHNWKFIGHAAILLKSVKAKQG